MSTGRELRRERYQPVRVDTHALTHPHWPQLGIRALFGGAIALVAGLGGMRFGPLVGGVFLAFPAVLPAALTLLEREEGTDRTSVDAVGAISGAVGMLGFAALLAVVSRGAPPAAILGAVAGWLAISIGLFVALRVVLRRWGYHPGGSRRTGGRRSAM